MYTHARTKGLLHSAIKQKKKKNKTKREMGDIWVSGRDGICVRLCESEMMMMKRRRRRKKKKTTATRGSVRILLTFHLCISLRVHRRSYYHTPHSEEPACE